MRLLAQRGVLRAALFVLALALFVVACNGGNQPPPGGGPEFVINSPQQGSFTAGTFFFAIQPFDPGAVASVSFSAGGAGLGTDANGADGFKLFVNAADHTAGNLNLTATVTGHDGRTRSHTVTVSNVPNPPSSATVGAGGAALGTLEADGSLSTLVVPPDTATGAFISFEARTQAEITAATGVDYDALGVTFLGAQEIDSTVEIERPLTVTSGGFGEFVQPNQVVVNYLIAPDADGDNIGEIVVVNTASVAPNGDVISDPVPIAQLGVTASTVQQGVLRQLQLGGGISGPPGTLIEIAVSGFNALSAKGSIARFEQGSTTIELIGSIETSGAGAQTLLTVIPSLPPGAASLILLNVGSGYASEAIAVTVEPAPPVQGDPAQVIAASLEWLELYYQALAVLVSGDPVLAAEATALGQAIADEVRANVAALLDSGTPEDLDALESLAGMLQVANVDALFQELIADITPNALTSTQQGKGKCLPENKNPKRPLKPFGADKNGTTKEEDNEWWISKAARWLFKPDQPEGPPGSGGDCKPPPPPPPPPGPGGKSGSTGMGSAPPPGGSLSGGGSGGSSSGLRAGLSWQSSAFAEERGRYLIKVVVPGYVVPFSGLTDASGYFLIPMVPEGEPFLAVATDTLTGDTRTAEGVGPPTGRNVVLWFNFADGESAATTIAWDGGGDASSWHDPLNWNKDRLPVPSDEVTIDLPSANVLIDIFSGDTETVRSLRLLQGELTVEQGNLRLVQESLVEGTLALTGGNLRLEADVVLDGQLDWVSGAIYGPSEAHNDNQIIVTSSFGSGIRELIGSKLLNAGLLRVTGEDFGGALRLGNGTVFENLPGAVFELDGDVSLAHTAGGERPVFHNHGLILKTGGTYVSDFMAVLHNYGAEIRVEGGTLWASYGGSLAGGLVEIASGATLDLGLYQGSGTTHTDLSGVLNGLGAGQLRLVGGNFAVDQAGATLDFPVGGVYWCSAGVQGPGALRNEGLLTIAQILGGTTRELRTTLVNAGTVELIEIDSNIGLRVGQVAAFENLPGAVFDFQSDIDILNNLDVVDGEVPFVNAGSVIKSAGVGVSRLEVCYEEVDGGSFEAVTGSFEFQCP